jgi:molybdopterin-guanine dinucleotide biosynthesis protein A
MMVADLFPVRSSLTGVHAGLFHAPSSHVFVSACDTPFLQRELVLEVLNGFDPKWDVIIPETKKGLQPLCAVYSKRCLKPIEGQLLNDRPRIIDFFTSVRVKKISEGQCREVDPDLVSFFNVNTPHDLEVAEAMWRDNPS